MCVAEVKGVGDTVNRVRRKWGIEPNDEGGRGRGRGRGIV